MPKDFQNEDHGLLKLHVTTRNGVVFASYASDMEPLEEYLTPEILEGLRRRLQRQAAEDPRLLPNELPCNWKMYHENLKDPYHATLLHSFLVVFGLLVAGNKSAMIADPVHGRHGTMASAKPEDKYAAVSDDEQEGDALLPRGPEACATSASSTT